MKYVKREIEGRIQHAVQRGRSVLLLGARQTGKTTLIGRMDAQLRISLVHPAVRLRYEKDPGALVGEVEAVVADSSAGLPLVIIDEVQKVPPLLDGIQDLIDRGVARFVLTGSSARKLRRSAHPNLLPGRVVVFHLAPFSLTEYVGGSLDEQLLYGALPGIVGLEDDGDREQDLSSYVTTYLEEEIRAEAFVRRLGPFARFLELSAAEAGGIINLRKLASEIGVAHTTIASYYQILEDCLICERIEPLTASATRKKLTKSDKYLFFDLGVRRLAAKEGCQLVPARMGQLFEQMVGLELVKWSRLQSPVPRIRFWRDPDGPEVDWIVERAGRYVPIEVKWTDTPKAADARHLECFLNEYPSAERGLIVCRVPRPMKISARVTAIAWQDLFDSLG